MAIEKNEASPMMTHYLQLKEQYKDTILFYRLGDFYEFFFEDAIEMSHELDLTLTHKAYGNGKQAPMCGIPFHSASSYIQKLVDKGYKVAICEQTSNVPEKGSKIVDREVVRIITHGTLIEEDMLDQEVNNYIACLYRENGLLAIAYCELTKGEFCVISFPDQDFEKINNFLQSIAPSEIITYENCQFYKENLAACKLELMPKLQEYYTWAFSETKSNDALTKQFGANFATVFELETPSERKACGALVQYLLENQKRSLFHINNIKKISNDTFLIIDSNTRRNLELCETIKDRKKKGSLLWLLDNTSTSMGARLLRANILRPIYDDKEINKRLDSVEELYKNLVVRDELVRNLKGIKDIERIIGRIACNGLNPKHLIDLAVTLNRVPEIKKLVSKFNSEKLVSIHNKIADFEELADELEMIIDEKASSVMKEGGFIRDGYDKQLDEYRRLSRHALEYLAKMELHEKEVTGIKNLKIGYNKVFGYYIEISKGQVGNVPYNYVRRQTLTTGERYITEELKNLEIQILEAKDNAIKLEFEIFAKIRNKLVDRIPDFQSLGQALSELDFLNSLASIAVKNNYVRPKISKKIDHINIVAGRHPVVEALLKNNEFVVNDTYLNTTTDKTMIITGPNMAGKSTYMRQVAVITLLAHIGSFVPAKQAEISLTDRIFTRVGASDDLAFGQSTFMVEMSEVANILHNATKNSLIILDEIGRGTSTFDGLSIAWAVVEYLSQKMNSKTLFATHYHELTELEGFMNGVKNYKITLKEIDGNIIFLRKITRGGANKSFGIEVASLAGLPKDVIDRAKEISKDLENSDIATNLALPTKTDNKEKPVQVKSYTDVISILRDIQIERLSPLSAFDILKDLAERVQSK